MSQTSPAHLYHPLQTSRSIRLLQLHPGSTADPISTSLREWPLDDAPPYEALSYAWGDLYDTRSITCQEVSVQITASLYDALLNLRFLDEPRFLWIDALCINQSDLEERGQQVRIMHLIYRFCKICLVWLGPGDEHSAAAFKIIGDLATLIAKRHLIDVNELDSHLENNGRDLTLTQNIGFSGLPSPDSRDWGSLHHFFSRSWFSRAWVLQEVYSSPRALFICGAQNATFSSVYHAADWALSNSARINWRLNWDLVQHYTTSNCANVLRMSSDKTSAQNLTLESLLGACKDFKTSEPRDKVFALMNLPAFQKEYPDLTPDYRMPVVDLYMDVTLHVIRRNAGLSILTYVDRDLENSDEDFPSWVPRWHRANYSLNNSSMWYWYYSTGLSELAPPMSAELLPGKILRLSGFQFDVVEDFSIIDRSNYLDTQPAKPTFDNKTDWKPYETPNSGPYQSKPEVVKAYAMTLTAMCRESNGVFALHCAPENEPHHVSDFVGWLQWLRGDDGNKSNHYPPGLYSQDKPFLTDTNDEEALKYAYHYNIMFGSYVLKRRLIRTKKGYLGIGSYSPQTGDVVCVMYGGRVPLILRPRPDEGFDLVGDAYIHGIMHGEAMNLIKTGEANTRTFDIY
ncbi:hypothetical protein S40288_06701 [Stachybotrys chartarum IBT 40288]|nr:hypothetical protein S40288_06701 [Stachybotrys chartarum IBT 40288]